MPTILGLDLGPASIGWALIEHDTDRNGNIGKPIGLIDAGAYVFPEGVARTPQGYEKSRTAQRRTARSARRLYQRRSRRREVLKRIMQEADLMPTEKDDWDILIRGKNPYDLRARGIKEQLTLHQLGRALYHLAQHRGFKSNRKSEVKDYKSKIEPQIKELQQKIEESGCRTLGEYLSKINPHTDRIRGRYTSRDM